MPAFLTLTKAILMSSTSIDKSGTRVPDPPSEAKLILISIAVKKMEGVKYGPPKWKQHPTWHQISEGDYSIQCSYYLNKDVVVPALQYVAK